MSFSTDAPVYQLKFTDGSIISMPNVGTNAPYYIDEYELIVPNLYFGTFLGDSLRAIKYDELGNKYEFDGASLAINDGERKYASDGRACLGYNPDTNELILYSFNTGTAIPFMEKTTWECQGIAFKRDTSGTVFDSFGEAMYYGHEVYTNPPPTYSGWYKLENITSMSINVPFYGANLFGGVASGLSRTLISCLFWHIASHGGAFNIDLSSILDDYDPETHQVEDDDPYEPDDVVDPTGGGGNHDDSSDDIDVPPLPTLSAVDAGFITLYRPDSSELRALANYLWSSPLQVWDNVKKIVADPMECILGLSIVPVNPTVGSAKSITVADVPTGVSAHPVTSQYVEVECGTIHVPEYWGAYIDYEPYTKAEIYLPYIGTHPISIDDIMGKDVRVVYHVDVLSGSCTAYIKCGRSVLYSFIGQCASSIPIAGKDWTNVISGALTIATAIGSMVASGGASAPMSASATPEQIAYHEAKHTAAMIRQGGAVASNAVNVLKPSIEKSGSMSGTGGLMSIQKPYLILTRPKQAIPDNQNHFMGYPSFMTAVLGTLSGYTEMEYVHLDDIHATDNEIAEIEKLLVGGVYL